MEEEEVGKRGKTKRWERWRREMRRALEGLTRGAKGKMFAVVDTEKNKR